MAKKKLTPAPALERELPLWLPPALGVLCALGALLTTASTGRVLLILLILGAVGSCLVRYAPVRERITLPLLAVGLWVVMNGASMFYAQSGKFAFREFRWIATGFCVLLLILAWGGRGERRGRGCAGALSAGIALLSLVSIDMLSTHLLSGAVFRLLGLFGQDYAEISQGGVEEGIRMTSILLNPNVFGGMTGLGVLLALGLALTAQGEGERRVQLVCLFWSALGFLLAFSMGATAMLGLAALVYLAAERPRRRGGLLLMMAETALLALAAAFPIFRTSFKVWSGARPIPLVCALAGAGLLCALDHFLVLPLSRRLEERGRLVAVLTAGALVLAAGFGALAVTVTGPAALAPGESLRRGAYPAPGTYTLELEASAPVEVAVESQNRAETMMHTSSELYRGAAEGAAFMVPQDSLVVYFTFTAPDGAVLTRCAYTGEGGGGELRLGYRLLPGFIANRLQGLRANENAIQRTVFFEDGMKLFRQSPLFGLGLGSFENGIRHAQTFDYETKYAHNHYIETLVGTGVAGLVLFLAALGLLLGSLVLSRRREGGCPLVPALLAALLFMAGHAGVEVIFSSSHYLFFALGVWGLILLCTGEELPLPRALAGASGGIALGTGALLLAFAVTVGLNARAASLARQSSGGRFFANLETAAAMDLYENADYKLSYVVASLQTEPTSPEAARAAVYAAELARKNSNSIPPYLARYYFTLGQNQEGFRMLERFVDYVPADSETWQRCFDLLETFYREGEGFREEAAALYERLEGWNRDNLGELTLTEKNLAFLRSVL